MTTIAALVGTAALFDGRPAAAEGRGTLGLSGGVGLVFPDGDIKGGATGGFVEITYSLPHLEYLRFYSGTVITRTDNGSCGAGVPCEFSSNLFFVGAKLRMSAPIPHASPFVELGVGGSFGTLTARSGDQINVASRGALLHIPISLGLAAGRRNRARGLVLVPPDRKCGRRRPAGRPHGAALEHIS